MCFQGKKIYMMKLIEERKFKMINKISKFFKYTKDVLNVLWKNDKLYIFYVFCDILISSVLPFIDMFLIKYSIDMLSNASNVDEYIYIVITIIIVGFFLRIIQSFLNYKRDVCGNMIGIRMYEKLYKKTMHLDYEMLLDKDIMEHRELALKVIDGMHITHFTQSFKTICSNFIVLIGLISLLATMDFWIVCVAFSIVIVNSFAASYRKKTERKLDDDFVSVNRKIDYFFDIGADFSYSKEIRVYHMISPLLKIYRSLTDITKKLVQKLLRMLLTCRIISYILSMLLDIIMYVSLGFKVLISKKISVGDFSLYLNTIHTFNSSMTGIATAYIDINNHGQYIQKYLEYIDMPTTAEQKKRELQRPKKYIFTFENVSYKYPHQTDYAIKNLNLTIGDNEKVAIVGENGAGKTTMILLLMGLIEPTEGRILLNGTSINEYTIDDYLKIFSTVFQDYKLFAFQVKDNISALDESKDTEEIVSNVADKVGLNIKIDTLKKGIYTYIDQIFDADGVHFSGGESQRLAIARALYKNAPVVILDEPTAALDPRIEHEIYTKFDEISKNKTTFYITHRLASTQFCDKVVVLKDGNLEAIGTHCELLRNSRYYCELYDMQAKFYRKKNESKE